jgi:hypothetical protein
MKILKFDPISSRAVPSSGTGGVRDYTVSFVGDLKPLEIVTDVTVTSGNTDILTISNDTIALDNTSVDFTVTITAGAAPQVVEIDISFVGNIVSSDTYTAEQPIVDTLRN